MLEVGHRVEVAGVGHEVGGGSMRVGGRTDQHGKAPDPRLAVVASRPPLRAAQPTPRTGTQWHILSGYEREWDTVAVGGSRAELDEIARQGHLALARGMKSITVT